MAFWRVLVVALAGAAGAGAATPSEVQPVSALVELARYPGADPTQRPPSVYGLTDDQLGTLIKQLRSEGKAWASQPNDDAPRRRLVFAALVLDVADATSWWNRVEYNQDNSISLMRAARPLFEDACALIRANPMGEPERQWMLASVAYGQTSAPALLLPGRDDVTHESGVDHLSHAHAALPGNLRLKLASAVSLTMRDWSLTGERVIAGTDQLAESPPASRYRVIYAMEALTKEPALAAEAHLFIAFQQFLMSDATSALTSFKRASTGEDPYVRYLAFLLAGRMLDRLGQPDDAEVSYRLALTALPRTRSGVESLSTRLMLRGDRQDAAELVDAMFAAPRTELDPWFTFSMGDYRRFPEYMTSLRRGLIR